jgi:hypothetical protein
MWSVGETGQISSHVSLWRQASTPNVVARPVYSRLTHGRANAEPHRAALGIGRKGRTMEAIGPSDPVLAELRVQTRWLRFIAIQAALPRVHAVVVSPAHRRVYDLSNGVRSTREVASAASVGVATVSRLWNQWAGIGLMIESDRYPGRYERVTRLGDVAWTGPTVEE